MITLPNAESAFVEPRKISAYLLNLSHPEGRTKAQFFVEFGFGLKTLPIFEYALLRHARTTIVTSIKDGEFGIKYTLTCQIESPDGRNPCIDSVWHIDRGGGRQKLATAYPAKARSERILSEKLERVKGIEPSS